MRDMASAKAKVLVTVADLLREPDKYEFCEVWDGALMVREPSNFWPECVGAAALVALHGYVVPRGLGLVSGSQAAFVVARDPDWVLVPDVSFIAREKRSGIPARGFVPFAPDIAIEVRSPSDPWGKVTAKAGVWLAFGVPLVWAIDPQTRLALVFERGKDPVERRPGQWLTGAPVLPRFRMRVEALFVDLDP